MGQGWVVGKRGRSTRKLMPLIGVFIASVAFALVGVSSAGAATVLSQDFESGLGGWTTSGLWHIQNNPQTIAVNPAINPTLVTLPDSGALPAAYQGSNVAWFGEASTGTYCGATSINNPNFTQGAKGGCTSVDANGNSMTETGDLISPSFSLAGVNSPQLQFASWWEIEGVAPTGFDTMEVDYSLNGGVSYTSLGKLNPTTVPTSGSSDQDYTNNGLEVPASWKLYSFNLAALAGQPNVKLRFHFDTVDNQYNGFRGWLVDSVVVSGSGGPPAASTGPASVQSSSATLTGSVNPQGFPTSAVFQYGLDPSYTGGGSVTYTNQVTASPNPVGSDNTNHSVSASVTGLVPNALYHVRVVAVNSGGTSFGPDLTFRTNKAGAPGRPVLGKSFNAVPVSGLVYVKVPGSTTSLSGPIRTGPGFVPLTQISQLPAGTQIDVRYGSIKIITATGNKGKRASKLQNGTFNGGIFNVKQARSGRNRGLVTLKLLYGLFPGAPSFASCTAKGAEVHAPLAHVASVLSTLRSRSHGRYSTSGRYGSATSRGTAWTITDRCKSTLVTVQQDTVVVRDFVHHRTITLHRGQRILIKARR